MATERPDRLRQSPRLLPFDYEGGYAYHLGAATRGRLPVFLNDDAARATVDALVATCEKYQFRCHAYCVMPDHVHLLVESQAGKSAEEFMRLFKQLSGFAYKKRTGQHLWQISFYDRILRSDEAILPLGNYIWANPLRAGLVTEREDYPYSGPVENMAL